MHSFKVDGREIKLEELGAEDVSARKLIGTAEGIDFNHCLYLGMRHGTDFVQKVRAFKRCEAKNGGPMAISFYE